jgi:hypothetical protein
LALSGRGSCMTLARGWKDESQVVIYGGMIGKMRQ